uniref:Uncharacterized protein n=1 Tax=Anguilla anguilla TaxID=7936 RepID=A0A0E9QGN2_ANGAN
MCRTYKINLTFLRTSPATPSPC